GAQDGSRPDRLRLSPVPGGARGAERPRPAGRAGAGGSAAAPGGCWRGEDGPCGRSGGARAYRDGAPCTHARRTSSGAPPAADRGGGRGRGVASAGAAAVAGDAPATAGGVVTAPVTVEGDVREDFVAFCDRFNEPLFDWQREVAGEAFKREGGRFKYRLVAISAPRGDGKSALPIKLGRWLLLRKPRQHILTAALTTTGTRGGLGGGGGGVRGGEHGGVKVVKDR